MNPLRLFRLQAANVLYFVQIQAARRELGDRVSSPGPDFHIEQLGSYHATNCAFVHGEEMSTHPIPALAVVTSVEAYPDLHFRLPPKAWIVGPPQPGSGTEVGTLVLAV